MADFLDALGDPDLGFLRYSLAMGLLASVAFGILGSYVVVRRTTYIADAIAHCVLGGIGAAMFVQWRLGQAWCDPMIGAVAAALAAALGIGLVSLYAKQREDTVISVVWVSGVAVGLLLLEQAQRSPDVAMSYLFGSDILLIAPSDLWMVAALDLAVMVIAIVFRDRLLAVSFDSEFAELRGVRAKAWHLLLLCLTALAVVLLVRVVGILLVVALMSLPAAIASFFSRRLWQMMLLASVFCAVFVTAGLALSYHYETRSGPTIICLAAAIYLAVAAGFRLFRPRAG